MTQIKTEIELGKDEKNPPIPDGEGVYLNIIQGERKERYKQFLLKSALLGEIRDGCYTIVECAYGHLNHGKHSLAIAEIEKTNETFVAYCKRCEKVVKHKVNATYNMRIGVAPQAAEAQHLIKKGWSA